MRQKGEIIESPEEGIQIPQSLFVRAPKRERQPAAQDCSRDETGLAQAVGDVEVEVDFLHGVIMAHVSKRKTSGAPLQGQANIILRSKIILLDDVIA